MIDNPIKNKEELLKLLEFVCDFNLDIHNNFNSVYKLLNTHDSKHLLGTITYKLRKVLDESIKDIKLKLDKL